MRSDTRMLFHLSLKRSLLLYSSTNKKTRSVSLMNARTPAVRGTIYRTHTYCTDSLTFSPFCETHSNRKEHGNSKVSFRRHTHLFLQENKHQGRMFLTCDLRLIDYNMYPLYTLCSPSNLPFPFRVHL